jgi:tetratricopeptide (TPR) repeat protein
MLQYRMFADNPMGYHLTNVIVHAIVAIVVFFLVGSFLKQVFGKEQILAAFLASLLFAVHPVHTEPVAWISGTGELLMSLFCLLSFLVYINGRKYSDFILSALLLLAGALFKVTAIFYFPLFIVYDWAFKKASFAGYPDSNPGMREMLKRYSPFLIALTSYLLLRTFAIRGFIPEKGYDDFGLYKVIINVIALFSQYVFMLLVPMNLTIIHVFKPLASLSDARMLPAMGIVIVFVSLIFFALMKNRGLFISLSWIVLPLIPVLYFPAFTSEAVFAERYLYLPSVGFVLAVAVLLTIFYQSKLSRYLTVPAIILSFTVLLISFSLVSRERNLAWRDNHSLWTDTVKKSPYSYTAHNNLGNVYYQSGFLDDAIREYRIALFLNPGYRDAANNLSTVAFIKEAIDSHRK